MRDRGLVCAGLLLALAGCAARQPVVADLTAGQLRQRTGLAPPAADRKPDGSLPPGVNLSDGISEDEAAAVALWNNGQLLTDLAAVGIAKANLLDAGVLRNPSVSLLIPVGAKPFEFVGSFPLEQFYQRPKRIAAAQKQWEQVAQSLVQNGINVVRDARQAHLALWVAQDRIAAARQAVELREQIAKITAARLRAGDIGEREVKAADAETVRTRDQLNRLLAEIPVARERLRFQMGLRANAAEWKATAGTAVPAVLPEADALREKAWASRPDLRSIEISIAAAAERAKWERSRLYVLAAQISSKDSVGRVVRTGPAATFDLPVFQSTAGLVARADAEVKQATIQYLAQKQRIDFEVSEAHELLRQAREAHAEWRDKVLPSLEQTLQVAKKAYAAGDVAYLAVLEATSPVVDARLRMADLEAAERRAFLDLERSIGVRWEARQ